ncbi:LamG-like jellyroll fold domain-containing protein [Serratia rubidaea]|uniref:LamG-like jellyroll fold domain-containing protein n=1 Tax=Serratia rubidaea TaxID=61652 RepID=UPI0022B88B43|nr:LamG-like jellyroll fold domain-containing protein [Serratia rubidaea]WBF43772.1 LamG domain-containing protein [Serratia rubidaea]
MSGVRIFCNEIIPITDWNHDFEIISSKLQTRSPLPTIASQDLLNPLDNTGNGYNVQQGGAEVRAWGVHFEDRAKPAPTALIKPGQGAVSFLTAFRFDALNRYTNIFSCRNEAADSGHGFNLYWSGGLLMGFAYPSGEVRNISGGDVAQPETGKWYVAAGVFDPVNRKASVLFSDLGLRFGDLGENIAPDQTLSTALAIGGGPDGKTTSSMRGDIAFLAMYDGAFSADQRTAMIAVGQDILKDRKLIA